MTVRSKLALTALVGLYLCLLPINAMAMATISELKNKAQHQTDVAKRIELLKQIGDYYYWKRKVKPALTNYQTAIQLCKSSNLHDSTFIKLLESEMGCLVLTKQFSQAETCGNTVLQEVTAQPKSGNIEDASCLLWAQLQLMDLYRRTGQNEKRLALRPSVGATLDQILALEDNYKLLSAPLIVWRPQNTEPRAAILCIHALGLENRAFAGFGPAMTKRGFIVYALDVRGFGSWLTAPGHEDVHFDPALLDIGAVIDYIKKKNNSLPTFVLGESMGGAIALRSAALYSNKLNGVISSVPSAERFQNRSMRARTAVNFIKGPDKPFDVGDMIADKASSRAELKDLWWKNPKSKTQLTPIEMTKFALFMVQTKKECKLIDTTPVLVVQGLEDHLVKPKGTYKMFKAVSSPDKKMLILGDAEHLIFETDEPSVPLLDLVSTWMDNHLAAPAKATQL